MKVQTRKVFKQTQAFIGYKSKGASVAYKITDNNIMKCWWPLKARLFPLITVFLFGPGITIVWIYSALKGMHNIYPHLSLVCSIQIFVLECICWASFIYQLSFGREVYFDFGRNIIEYRSRAFWHTTQDSCLMKTVEAVEIETITRWYFDSAPDYKSNRLIAYGLTLYFKDGKHRRLFETTDLKTILFISQTICDRASESILQCGLEKLSPNKMDV